MPGLGSATLQPCLQTILQTHLRAALSMAWGCVGPETDCVSAKNHMDSNGQAGTWGPGAKSSGGRTSRCGCGLGTQEGRFLPGLWRGEELDRRVLSLGLL